MEYAVIATGGKQYIAEPGKKLIIESLPGEPGSSLTFDRILLHVDGNGLKIGKPVVEGLTVEAKVLEQGLAEKIRVFKYKAKSRYRRTQGHRQHQTVVEIVSIGTKPAKKEVVKKEAKAAPKAEAAA